MVKKEIKSEKKAEHAEAKHEAKHEEAHTREESKNTSETKEHKENKKDTAKFAETIAATARKSSIYIRSARLFQVYLAKAGIEAEPAKVSKSIFYFAIFLNFLVSIYLVYFFSIKFNYPIIYVLTLMVLLWLLVFIGLILILYLLFFIMLDLRIFKRTMDIEEVLPDFLELTSANIRAGMPIDQALWFAVRPRFGVLAKEIETVAKETMSGEDLEVALLRFTNKYESGVLDRSVNLLIEGMTAGGELGYLLNRIANNIQESRTIKKEMSANVTTYVIFITFASIVAAPVLFALSGQLLVIVSGIIAKMSLASSGGSTTGIAVSAAGSGVSFADFKMFSIGLLCITALFSSLIVAIIKKGDIKPGLSYIPRFIVVSMVVYWLASKVLASTLGSMF